MVRILFRTKNNKKNHSVEWLFLLLIVDYLANNHYLRKLVFLKEKRSCRKKQMFLMGCLFFPESQNERSANRSGKFANFVIAFSTLFVQLFGAGRYEKIGRKHSIKNFLKF
jgi:hypothetical protein